MRPVNFAYFQAGRAEACGRGRAFRGNETSSWEGEEAIGIGDGHVPASQPSSSHEVMVFEPRRSFSHGRKSHQGSFLLGALMPYSSGQLFAVETARDIHSVRFLHATSDDWLVQRARADKRRREERARKLQSRVRTQDDDDVSYPDSGEFYMDSNSTQVPHIRTRVAMFSWCFQHPFGFCLTCTKQNRTYTLSSYSTPVIRSGLGHIVHDIA